MSYSLVRTTRGGFSVSVYQDKAGGDESTRAAREWIRNPAISLPARLEGRGDPGAAAIQFVNGQI